MIMSGSGRCLGDEKHEELNTKLISPLLNRHTMLKLIDLRCSAAETLKTPRAGCASGMHLSDTCTDTPSLLTEHPRALHVWK